MSNEFIKNIKMGKKIIGIGGDEPILGNLKRLEKMVLDSSTEKTVCYIPIGVFNNYKLLNEMDEYIKKVEKYYQAIDKKVKFISVTIHDGVTEIVNKINNSNILYIAGGDTKFLIDRLKNREINFALKKAYESGKYIIGNSAGILSLLSDTFSIDNNNVVHEYHGIGLLDNYIVIVHYDESKKTICERISKKFPEKKLILLKDSDAVLFLNEKQIFYKSKHAR